jgi:hypothetical protein
VRAENIAFTVRTSLTKSAKRCHRAAFRLTNQDVIDLYNRVQIGATVIVQ